MEPCEYKITRIRNSDASVSFFVVWDEDESYIVNSGLQDALQGAREAFCVAWSHTAKYPNNVYPKQLETDLKSAGQALFDIYVQSGDKPEIALEKFRNARNCIRNAMSNALAMARSATPSTGRTRAL